MNKVMSKLAAWSQQHQIKNEVLFKKARIRMLKGLKELDAIEKTHSYSAMLPDVDMPILFSCECSDAACRERIVLKSSQYQILYKDHNRLILAPGHRSTVLPYLHDNVRIQTH